MLFCNEVTWTFIIFTVIPHCPSLSKPLTEPPKAEQSFNVNILRVNILYLDT